MEKEDNRPSGASMTEADFAYLRNINTSPGPNAGRSIDPTKPGPDADRIAELEREIAELEAANEAASTWGAAVGARWEQIKGLQGELSRLRAPSPGPQDVLATARKRIQLVINEIADAELIMMLRTAMSEIDLAALAQSDAQSPQDELWQAFDAGVAWQKEMQSDAQPEQDEAGAGRLSQKLVAFATALAQSDAQPAHHAASQDYWRRSRAADAQFNAQPVAFADWPVSATECAKEIMTYLGIASDPSLEPGMDRRRDNVAQLVERHWRPRPDTSGLLEAAEMAHEKAMLLRDPQSSAEMFEFEEELRARAADRSGK